MYDELRPTLNTEPSNQQEWLNSVRSIYVTRGSAIAKRPARRSSQPSHSEHAMMCVLSTAFCTTNLGDVNWTVIAITTTNVVNVTEHYSASAPSWIGCEPLWWMDTKVSYSKLSLSCSWDMIASIKTENCSFDPDHATFRGSSSSLSSES